MFTIQNRCLESGGIPSIHHCKGKFTVTYQTLVVLGQDDAWVIVNGDALDVTKWIPIHPGGEQAASQLRKDGECWDVKTKMETQEA